MTLYFLGRNFPNNKGLFCCVGGMTDGEGGPLPTEHPGLTDLGYYIARDKCRDKAIWLNCARKESDPLSVYETDVYRTNITC